MEGNGCNGSAALNILNADTDGDRVRDGAECTLGSNPSNAASKPAPGTPDSDGDTIHDGIETLYGWNPNNVDTDGDGVSDGIEFKGYSTAPQSLNSDTDSCQDDAEVASVNTSNNVDVIDLGIVGANQATPGFPNYDMNKNGSVDVIDLGFVAANVQNC